MIANRFLIALCTLLITGCTTSGLRESYLELYAPFIPPPERPVIVMSGFGNARLFDPATGRFVWGTAHATMQTRFADNLDLAIDPETGEVTRDRLIAKGFVGYRSPLNFAWHIGRALERYGQYSLATLDSPAEQPPRTVYRFSYDWRLSATDNARALDALIEEIRRAYGQPGLKVDIVGHSLGGFIALTYLRIGTASIEAPETWDAAASAAASKIGRLVLIGAPQEGAVDAFRVMVRPERFVFRVLRPDWTALYPSVSEMLPADGKVFIDEQGRSLDIDLWDAASWREYRFSVYAPDIQARHPEDHEALAHAFENVLARAHRVRRIQDRPLPPPVQVTAIASDCIPTTRRILLRGDGSLAFYPHELRENERHLTTLMFAPGDGSVTAESATGALGDRVIFCDGHQGMALDPNVHHAVLRALNAERGL